MIIVRCLLPFLGADFLHIGFEAIALSAVADEAVGGIWTASAAWEWTAGPIFQWHSACRREGVWIVAGSPPVFSEMYEHKTPFRKRKKGADFIGLNQPEKSAPFGVRYSIFCKNRGCMSSNPRLSLKTTDDIHENEGILNGVFGGKKAPETANVLSFSLRTSIYRINYGGGEESRTPVRRTFNQTFSERRWSFDIPSTRPRPSGFAL